MLQNYKINYKIIKFILLNIDRFSLEKYKLSCKSYNSI